MKVISFINQKGGVGKSTLTNITALEIGAIRILEEKKPVKILVIDIDNQDTLYNHRIKNLSMIEQIYGNIDTMSKYSVEDQQIYKDYLHLNLSHNWVPYDVHNINTTDIDSLESGISLIQRNEDNYDYIFIDFPGSVEQEGTERFLYLIDHIFIPLNQSNYDLDTSLQFYHMMKDHFSNIKTIYWLFNHYKMLQKFKYDSIQADLEKETSCAFLETRVKDITYYRTKTYNSMIPCGVRYQSTTKMFVENIHNVRELALEILAIID